MTIYKCFRCNYKTSKKSSIQNHYKRKSPCKVSNKDISLEECLNMLNNKKILTVEEQLRQDNVKLLNALSMMQERLIKLENRVQGSNNTNCHNDNSTHNQISININSYKNTDYKAVEKALTTCIKSNGEIDMGKLIEAIHFNDEAPQNHNVYIANSKTKRIMKYDGKKFEEDGRGDKGLEILFNEKLGDIEENEELNDKLKFAGEETWMTFNTNNDKDKKEILGNIYKPLYNKREKVLN